jgi:hypothetical protein
MEAYKLKMESWRVCRPMVANLNQDQDPDPLQMIPKSGRMRIIVKRGIRIPILLFRIRNTSFIPSVLLPLSCLILPFPPLIPHTFKPLVHKTVFLSMLLHIMPMILLISIGGG